MTNLSDFEKREKRRIALWEFQKKISKEILEDAKKPWWIQQQEYGDYHYNDFDMEPQETNEGDEDDRI